MLIESPDFQAWLARYDADVIERRAAIGKPSPFIDEGTCDCCGGPIGDTPSRAGEECLICLAEQYGAEHTEQMLIDKFVTGLVSEAINGAEPNLLPDTIRKAVDKAIDGAEFGAGHNVGRAHGSCER